MTNNDVLRRLRYTFSLKDNQVKAIFSLANREVSLEQVRAWLLKDDDEQMVPLADIELASFLNGFIVERRGRGDGEMPQPEKDLSKNLILKKLKIALALKTEDIISLLEKVGVKLGKPELTAFFRNPEHKNYRHCKAQVLRNFLMALQQTHRGQKPNSSSKKNKPKVAKEKTLYVNPYAKAEEKLKTRSVLKLKK